MKGNIHTHFGAILIFCVFLAFSSCREEPTIIEKPSPELLQFSLSAEKNPLQIVYTANGSIDDSSVTVRVENILSSYVLTPTVQFSGDSVTIAKIRMDNVDHAFDFSEPQQLIVYSGKLRKEYIVSVLSYNGLPIVWIETEQREDIVSRDEFLTADFRLDDISTKVNIIGRGNSTWEASPKKPYTLKFDEKRSLLTMPEDKSWVLLANFFDKTSLRNATAFYLSRLSLLDYTPRAEFIDLMLNGRYNGTYQLTEKIKIGKNRVNIGNGYLLEIDAKYDENDSIVCTQHLIHPVNIKEPDNPSAGDVAYVRDYLTRFETVLYSDYFTDADSGWTAYMDLESAVDWYLVQEIAKNTDGEFFSSCYMTLAKGGKLQMGPVWDFDIAFGNVNYNDNWNPEGLFINGATWYSRLFQDPVFVAHVKQRYDYFYSHKYDIIAYINIMANKLRYSVEENEKRWGVFYTPTWPNYDILGSYQNEVQSLKEWINRRMDWLKTEFNGLSAGMTKYHRDRTNETVNHITRPKTPLIASSS